MTSLKNDQGDDDMGAGSGGTNAGFSYITSA